MGYSGGLDSSVLLHILAERRPYLGVTLSALHVHHGLSANADAWTAHCRQVCSALNVPLRVERVSVTSEGKGPEAAARAARYRVFASIAADCLALAHHRDDQVETVLLQLLRGAGLKGLAAMPEARRLDGSPVRLLRPLLATSRAELEVWARRQEIAWIEDESNLHTHLARNALRQAVLPVLARNFPDAAAVLAESAGRFAEAADLLDDLADQDAGAGPDLEVGILADLSAPRARNVLRRRLELAGARLSQQGLHEALRQLLTARSDAQLEIRFGAMVLRRHRGRVYCVPWRSTDRADPGRIWRGEAELALGEAGWLRFESIAEGGVRRGPEPVCVRFRTGGERLRSDARRPRRSLKELLRTPALPPWQRNRLPMVYVGDRLAWVATIGADVDCLAASGEQGWRLVWEPKQVTWPGSPDSPR